jgi:hypothetical protein
MDAPMMPEPAITTRSRFAECSNLRAINGADSSSISRRRFTVGIILTSKIEKQSFEIFRAGRTCLSLSRSTALR